MDLDEGFAPPQPLYGLTLFLGILYHLKNPFGVLEALADHSQFCLLSTRIAQNSPQGARMSDEALVYLAGEYELNDDESNFWIFSEAGLRRLLERTGWRVRGLVTTGCQAGSQPVRPDRDQRATCLVESLRAPRRDAPKLLDGWYGGESGWRWTAPEFSVEMEMHPLDAARGIELRFGRPAAAAAAARAVTVRARFGETELGAQTFEGAGEHVYSAGLPPTAGTGGRLRIDFSVSPAYRPPAPDERELGVQVMFEKTAPTLKRYPVHPIRLV
jgi:hypothetical protein